MIVRVIGWKYTLRSAALCAAVLVSACQSANFGSASNAGMLTDVLTSHQNSLPCQGGAPVPGGTPMPFYTPRTHSAEKFLPQPGMGYLYIADEYDSQIDIFPSMGRNQSQVGTITAGVDVPYGIWFDRGTQSLYVANQSNNTVTVYPYGSTQPSVTYSQGLNRPLFPIVDRYGDLFVSNANDGTVVEYLAGSTNVYQVLQTPGVEADGMAFDHQGHLYVAYRTCPSGDGSIEKFAPGSSQGKVIGMTLSDPQGITVDYKGNIIVDETGTANQRITQIEEFVPGSKSPSVIVQMPNNDLPIELLLDCDEKHLYVASLFAGAALGAGYPLTSQTQLFVKDQVSAIVQGVTMTNNLEL